MSKLSVFNFVTLNGFFKGPNDDVSWAHESSEPAYAEEMLEHESMLLFGRKTYEQMVSYWPTPQAAQQMPKVAAGMNKADKIVFSRTLPKVEWKNARLVKDNIVEETRKLKQLDKNMTLLGSGSIVALFAQHGLIDEYQILVHPVALGDGTPMFKGMDRKLKLELVTTRAFKTGNVLLCYRRA